jgi:hypothetical protein
MFRISIKDGSTSTVRPWSKSQSEEKDYPVESALAGEESRGWRAAESGTQTIRLIFDEPQRLKRIALVLQETQTQPTQEFVLRRSGDDGRSFGIPALKASFF